jgi:hypothetical protein
MEGKSVMPMEITFMGNGGNIFVLDELIEQMNSYICFLHVNSSLDEFMWNPYRFLISSLGLPTFFLRIAKRERQQIRHQRQHICQTESLLVIIIKIALIHSILLHQ